MAHCPNSSSVVLALTLTLGGTAAGHAGAAVDRGLVDSVVALERGVSALSKPAADFSTILRDLTLSLPAGSPGFVKADLRAFLSRVPDSRSDFRCSAEFVRDRARKELLRLKDVLLDANPQPARPLFCYAVPFVIDPTQAPGPINIYGYDFDRGPEVQVLLMDAEGFQDVTFAVTARTHYRLTLDLEKHGVRFSPDNQRLALTVGHVIQHAIPLVQASTPLCESRVEETPAGKTVDYEPPPLDSPGVFAGDGAAVLANAVLEYESNGLAATVCLTAVEGRGNRKVRSGCAAEMVYTTDEARMVEEVVGDLDDRISYTHARQAEAVWAGGEHGPVSQWVFAGLNARDSVVREPQIAVRLRQIRFISTRMDACVSPIAYLEAKRTHVLGEAAVRRLDPQLKNVDASIVSVHPRFAPSGATPAAPRPQP